MVFCQEFMAILRGIPQWKTKMVIDKDIAEVVKNFLENYAEIHGLPSPGRSINFSVNNTSFGLQKTRIPL